VRVLHVNNVDLPGRRFNGYDLIAELPARGITCKQAVLRKLSDSPDVIQLLDGPDDTNLQRRITETEYRHSMNGLLYPWGRVLARTPEFEEADVVHYHLLHNRMISLLDLPSLFASKPSVWSFHDPWPMTGHCTYPMGCDRWRTAGCSECPRLSAHFPMKDDHADRMWRVKEAVYPRLDADIVVASDFMLDMVHASPLTSGFDRVHLIPFGVDGGSWLPDTERAASRARLGIAPDDFVVFLRSTDAEVKGLSSAIEALRSRRPDRPTTILTVDRVGLLAELAPDYTIVELGWVEDPALYPCAFSACDVFLMPSTAEAFGLMALEAMASGRPVICFEGTSLPSVVHAPECGVAVPSGDALALRRAIDALSADAADAERRGRLGRTIATEVYAHERYLDAMAALYRSLA